MQTFTLALVNVRKGIIGTAAGREQNVQGEEQNSNLFCWNFIIDGLPTHGYAKEMFKEMVNEVMFVSVLTA